jgi:hypothetical protein
MADNAKLLKEIRDNFTYASDASREIRAEAAIDMRHIAGDPWDPAERKARKDAGLLCLTLDELGQYVNQLINEVRQNKRAIKIKPEGYGAEDKHAELRANRIRQIERRSNAQAAYSCAFENAVQRSYGYAKVTTKYVSEDSFDVEPAIERIANPDTVYLDPDAKEADCSDMMYAFHVDLISRAEFKRRFPGAEIKDFTGEQITEYPQWIKENQVQVADYWKVNIRYRKLLRMGEGNQSNIYEDELPEGAEINKGFVVFADGEALPILKQRKCEEREVVQYVTNGVEILDKEEWFGKWIPIVPCFGKEIFVDRGAGAKRELMSLIRLARDPYMLYCYNRTGTAEQLRMTQKAPYIGYLGQFATDKENWDRAHKVPVPYLQVDPLSDSSGQHMLPLPQRQTYEPPIQAFEMSAESARRGIQAAMGITSLPTAAQRQNEKSGIALQRIEAQQQKGSFHFLDNYDRFLEHTGRILDDLLTKVEDTARDVGITMPDDESKVVHINEPVEEQGQPTTHEYGKGRFEVIVSTGPSYESQREEAHDFANSLAQNEAIFPRIADLVVKLKNLGPIGDQIADRLTPPEFASEDGQEPLPPQAVQAMQQMQQQLQALDAYAQQLQQELQKLQAEKEGKVVENESRERIAALNADVDKFRITVQALTKDEELSSRENVEVFKAQAAEIQARINAVAAEEKQEKQPAGAGK